MVGIGSMSASVEHIYIYIVSPVDLLIDQLIDRFVVSDQERVSRTLIRRLLSIPTVLPNGRLTLPTVFCFSNYTNSVNC